VQEHNFHTQAVFEIHKQVGKLESGLQNVENRLDAVEEKLDTVRSEIAKLNTTVETVKPLLVWACRGLLAIVAFSLTVAGMWLKHHFGW
jgi:septal ring factor EnvC (AmiA/AmiB activator)